MHNIPTQHFLILAAALLAIGLAMVLIKKNAIMVLMGIELMLNAANINLVAFSRNDADQLQGQLLALFVLVIAAAEASIALAMVIKIFHHFKTIDLDELKELKG